jgi:hypothetical protein
MASSAEQSQTLARQRLLCQALLDSLERILSAIGLEQDASGVEQALSVRRIQLQ